MAQLIAHADLTPAPWKNGGGSTTEIAVFPRGAGFDDFDWRVSLATIAQSGAFSIFPGIDRSLCLVAGDGVTLTLNDGRQAQAVLDAAHPLIRFPGEAAVQAEVGSPTTDFNVMTRRSRCRHRLERIAAPAKLARRGGATLLFLAAGAGVLARGGEHRFMLGLFDALLLDAGDAMHWSLEADAAATIFVVDLIT